MAGVTSCKGRSESFKDSLIESQVNFDINLSSICGIYFLLLKKNMFDLIFFF